MAVSLDRVGSIRWQLTLDLDCGPYDRFRCLHIPSFTQRVQDFHRQFPTSGGISSDQAAFLPLYTACLCASLHLMTDEVLRNTGYNQKERDAALSDWNELLEMTLVKIDWAGSPRLESLQAFM